jgi:alpha/beta superfamily hydrolase
MEPFYFGEPPKTLFGVYHPPPVGKSRDAGVILCSPMGQEYIRCHRSFLQVAKLLAASGFHVLRFDYFGCGDSNGAWDQWDFHQWHADISTAIDELCGGADVSRICLMGLRLGGSLSMQVAYERKDIEHLVLWDPVVNGGRYLEELQGMHKEWLQGSFAKDSGILADGAKREILGFLISESLEGCLQDMDLLSLTLREDHSVLLIDSAGSAGCDELGDHLRNSSVQLTHQHLIAPQIWIKKDHELDKGLVPMNVLDCIVSWVCEALQ